MKMNIPQIEQTPGSNGADHLVDLKGMAARLTVSQRSVWRLVASGDLVPPVKVGRLVRWFPEDLDEYLDKLRHQREINPQVVATRGANHEDVGVSDANASGDSLQSNQAPPRRRRKSS